MPRRAIRSPRIDAIELGAENGKAWSPLSGQGADLFLSPVEAVFFHALETADGVLEVLVGIFQ